MFYEEDEAKKEKMRQTLATESIPGLAKKLADVLAENGSTDFLVGSGLTWADIHVASHFDILGNWISNDWKAAAPTMATHMDKVFSLPNIKKWIDSRPKSDF